MCQGIVCEAAVVSRNDLAVAYLGHQRCAGVMSHRRVDCCLPGFPLRSCGGEECQRQSAGCHTTTSQKFTFGSNCNARE